jgi:hypothetical protein
VVLANAKHIKFVPGRKTDVKDAEWIADLLQHGLLKASFIPEAPQRNCVNWCVTERIWSMSAAEKSITFIGC